VETSLTASNCEYPMPVASTFRGRLRHSALDQCPLAGPFERLIARGDLELAEDRSGMGLDRVDGDVEGLTYLPVRIVAVEETQHVELAIGKHFGERRLCSPSLAQLVLLALEQIREYAGVGVSLHDVPRLVEKRPGPSPIAVRRPDPREGQQPQERGPRVYVPRPARREAAFQLGLGFVESPELAVHPA